MRRKVKVGKSFDVEFEFDVVETRTEDLENKPARRHVAVGQEFQAKVSLSGDLGDAANALTRYKDALTRYTIVWAVFTVIAVFLIGAAGLGLRTGEFSAMQAVWGVVGPIYGGIAGYFFSRHGGK
jgi:hypothetical protein